MKSYELASKTLSDLLKAPELAMERVDSTMAGLQEALADQKEVEDALSAGVDEGELEAELKELQEREVVGRAEQADGSSKNTAAPVEEVQTSRVPETEEARREAVPA
jgi:predicted transcriptional regulator